MFIDFSELPASKMPRKTQAELIQMRNEAEFKEYPSKFKKDKTTRKIRNLNIEERIKIHKDLNPFIIKENATTFGQFEVNCKAFENHEGKVMYSEEMPFARIYKSKENLMTVSNLTPKSKALFLWIIYSVDASAGFVCINEKRIMRIVQGLHSPNSLSKAIEELGKANILMEYIDPYFWVNPRFLFFGSRAYAYPSYRNL